MTIKDFKGQVKIADIQAAFNEIVNRINSMVDIYNNAAGFGDIDYTKGSPKLGSSGYCLTIGGLKTILNNYNNTLIGCNVYKIDDSTCLVSDGLYITSTGVYRIKGGFISGQSGWDMSELYYDIDNEAVIFKDGANQSVVEVTTGWTQPTINSNTECGIFTANYNSGVAYCVANNSGWSMSYSSTTGGQVANPAVTWNLPKTIKCSNISFTSNVNNILGSGNIVVYVNGEHIYTGAASSSHSINLNNREVDSITIGYTVAGGIGFSVNISNLLVSGFVNSYAYESGGVITPSNNIIKICDLNWRAKDGLIKDFKSLQLENLKDYRLKKAKRGYGRYAVDSLNTSNSGKFVVYSGMFSTGSYGSALSIMGERIIYNPRDGGDALHRSSNVAFSSTPLYIPKGATDNMTENVNAGRSVSDPSFEIK